MKFVAFERSKQGTGASRRLRNNGMTPGIVYGGSSEPKLIELDHNALWHALKKRSLPRFHPGDGTGRSNQQSAAA